MWLRIFLKSSPTLLYKKGGRKDGGYQGPGQANFCVIIKIRVQN